MDILKQLSELSEEKVKDFVASNKKSLLEEKLKSVKETDTFISVPLVNGSPVKKSLTETKTGQVDVTIVCNTAYLCDSHMDVMMPSSYASTVGKIIPHLKDHSRSIEGRIGDTKKVYVKEMSWKELGVDFSGSTVALLMDSTVKESYSPMAYNLYKNGEITNHSIGLTYEEIKLALNSDSEDDKEEFAVWNQYYPLVANKDLVDKRGYFWAVTKARIIENSAVLFGANPITPTLSTSSKATENPVSLPTSVKQENIVTIEELQQQLLLAQADLVKAKAEIDAAIQKGVQQERTRITGIMASASALKFTGDISKFIAKGLDVETVTDSLTLIVEATQKDNPSPTDKGMSGTTTEKTAPTTGSTEPKSSEEESIKYFMEFLEDSEKTKGDK